MSDQTIFLAVLVLVGFGLAFWWAHAMSLLITGILDPDSIDIDIGDL